MTGRHVYTDMLVVRVRICYQKLVVPSNLDKVMFRYFVDTGACATSEATVAFAASES